MRKFCPKDLIFRGRFCIVNTAKFFKDKSGRIMEVCTWRRSDVLSISSSNVLTETMLLNRQFGKNV